MLLALKIASLVLALILLLRLKVDLALAVVLVTAYTMLIFRVSLQAAAQGTARILSEPSSLQLLLIVVLVQYIGAIQKSRGMFDRLIRSLNTLIRDRRLVAMVAPALVGLLPMPGGALVSAPLVEVSTRNMRLKPAFNAFLNFWFRHDWELVWPLYAQLLLFQAMSRIPLRRIILYQFPFSLLHITTGTIVAFLYFGRHRIGREAPEPGNGLKDAPRDFLAGTWPLLLVILLFFLTVPLWLALIGVALLLSVLKRARLGEVRDIFLSRTMVRSVLVIVAVLVFQKMIQISAAFAALKSLHVSLGLVVLFIFLVSFTLGFLTGVNTAYIAIAFPVILPLIQGMPNYFYLALYVYVIGYAGILVSPLHLCLVLTSEYFCAPMTAVYRYMVFPVAAMIALSTLLVLVL